jgi:NADH:ubiquinone oxidoreductase subunit 2 (subunit N)
LLALTLTASLFSLAGIPPLAGFFSKFYLFFSALGSGLYFLAIAGVMSSVVSCFYYIRVIKTMYFETPEQWLVYKQVDKEKALLLALTSFFLIFFSLYPNPLFLLTSQIALDMSQSTLPLL